MKQWSLLFIEHLICVRPWGMRNFINEAWFDLYFEGKKIGYVEKEKKGNEDTVPVLHSEVMAPQLNGLGKSLPMPRDSP